MGQKGLIRSKKDKILIETMARFFSLIGINKNAGKVWTTIFLMNEEYVTFSMIHKAIDLSTGSISSSLKELRKYDLIEKISYDRSKTAFYKVKLSLWKTATILIQTKFLTPLEEILKEVESIYYQTEKMKRKRKIEEILKILRLIYALVKSFLITAKFDGEELKRFSLKK